MSRLRQQLLHHHQKLGQLYQQTYILRMMGEWPRSTVIDHAIWHHTIYPQMTVFELCNVIYYLYLMFCSVITFAFWIVSLQVFSAEETIWNKAIQLGITSDARIFGHEKGKQEGGVRPERSESESRERWVQERWEWGQREVNMTDWILPIGLSCVTWLRRLCNFVRSTLSFFRVANSEKDLLSMSWILSFSTRKRLSIIL